MLCLFNAALAVAPAAGSDFMTEVRPILEASCVECHARGRAEGGFSLESRASMLASPGAVSPGNAAGSRLIALVRGDGRLVMPYEGERLDASQIAALARWIDDGASWPDGFAFRDTAPARASVLQRRPEIPAAADGLENPIDRIVGAYARANDVALAPITGDAAFLRRASLDLVGLLPSVDQTLSFVGSDDLQKRQKLVHRLLDERHAYAAHWLSFWNDLLRNDYAGTGYIDGGRQQITDWLYRALADNKPYDRFVAELVDPTPATAGFAAGIAWRGESSASQATELQYARVVAQVFLGTNVKCASCHDSFINQWKLADTYGLAAIVADRPLELHRCDKPTGELARASFLYPELGSIDADAAREARLEQFAGLLTSPVNGRLTRTIVNRLWQRLMGRALVEPVDELDQPPWSRDLLDFLAADLADHGFDLKHTLELIATSRAYQRRQVAVDPQQPPEAFVFRGPAPRRMTAEQFVDAVWALSGAGPSTISESLEQTPIPEDASVRASLVTADALMRSLGRPNREQVVSSRPSELVMLQALDLTNGSIMTEQIRAAAEHLLTQSPSPSELVDHLFLRLMSRRPSDAEKQVALELLESEPGRAAIEDLLWILLMHPEFQLVG